MLIKRDQALRYANKLNYHSEASPASSGREPGVRGTRFPVTPGGGGGGGARSGRLRPGNAGAMAPSGRGAGAQPPPASRARGPCTDDTCPRPTGSPGVSTGSLTPTRGRAPAGRARAPRAGCHPAYPQGQGVLTEPGESWPTEDTQNTLCDSSPRYSHGPVGYSKEPVPESSGAQQERDSFLRRTAG